MDQLQTQHFYKTLFAIAVPIAIQSLITNLLNAIDVFMISSLGTASTGGVGMANKIFFLLNLFLFGTNSGAAILASQYWGIADKSSIKKVLGVSLMIGVGGSVVFTLGAILIPETLISILAPGQVGMISEGSKFLRIIGISYLFTAVTFSYSFILRTTHNAVVPMVITGIAIVVNTFLNWVLIFGKLGAPVMGVEGSALATVIARIFECVVLIIVVYRLDLAVAGKFSELFKVSFDFVKHYFKTVIFVILNEMIWSIGVVGYSLVYGRMGEVATASITITQTIEQLAFVVFFGLSNACGVMLGNLLGANELKKALSYSKKILWIVTGAAVVVGASVLLSAGPIAHLFNVEFIVQKNVINCLIVFALYMPLKMLNMVIIVGVLRSGGDTISSLLIDLIGVWVVGIPMAILGGLILKLDIHYVYALVMLEEVVKLVLSLLRYYSKKWVKNIVQESPA
ncbi:MAG: MATE family efflux transporter [Vallitaleaceae bacterium]|nr:MATE family efflux transporter [Vallitaleaceae bacterium]